MPVVTIYQNSSLNVSLPINLASRTVFRFYTADNNGNNTPLTGFTSANFVIYPEGEDPVDTAMQVNANGDVILQLDSYWWSFGQSVNNCAIFLDNDYVAFVSGTVAFGIVIQPNQAYAIMNASRNAVLVNGVQYENPRYVDSSTALFSVVVDSGTGVATVTVDTAGGTWYAGTGAPSGVLGADGSFYFDTQNYDLYGPKASGAWPTPISFVTDQDLIDALLTKQDVNNNLTQISDETFSEGDVIVKSGGILIGQPSIDLPLSTAAIDALGFKQDTSGKGQANGYAPLDGSALVPPQYLPSFSFPVDSVFGRTGDVVAQSGDYTAAQVGAQDLAEKNQASGYAGLDSSSLLNSSQIPVDAITIVNNAGVLTAQIETEIIQNNDSGTIGPIAIGAKPQTLIEMTGAQKSILGAAVPDNSFHKIIIIWSNQSATTTIVHGGFEDQTAFTTIGGVNLVLNRYDCAIFMFYPILGWVQISLAKLNSSGNSATATALQTGRTIAITGDLAYTSPAFDGTGNVTGSGALATVNGNVGSFGSATQVGTFTVNGKGLLTAAGNTAIQITESQVTNLTTDLAGKANSGANTDITSVLLNQTGLVVKGATAIGLIIKPNETYTSGRTLNLILNDADRTLTIAGSSSINGTFSGTSSGTNTGDQTSVTGNAGTATAWATGRTLAITGDLSYTSPSIDGTGNVTAAGTLATVNSNVGSFGSATQVPAITVNGKGLVTAVVNTAIAIAQSAVTNLVTDLAALGARFISTDQTITSAGSLSLAHGLGAAPVIVQAFLVCQTGEFGYAAGDVLLSNLAMSDSGSDSYGVSIVPTSTDINLRFGANANVFLALHKTTGAGSQLTNANWKLRIDAMR